MKKTFKFTAISLVLLLSTQAAALEEVGSDPRIKTLVYGKNDVFRINSVYGFQTVLELDPAEKIVTISVGNPNIFKIIPSQNRLFIKALQNSQITNMTIITDVRTYQIELTSNIDTENDTMYVARFVYPDSIASSNIVIADKPMSLYNSIPLQTAPTSSTSAIQSDISNQIPSASSINLQANMALPENGVPLSMQSNSTEVEGMLNVPKLSIYGSK